MTTPKQQKVNATLMAMAHEDMTHASATLSDANAQLAQTNAQQASELRRLRNELENMKLQRAIDNSTANPSSPIVVQNVIPLRTMSLPAKRGRKVKGMSRGGNEPNRGGRGGPPGGYGGPSGGFSGPPEGYGGPPGGYGGPPGGYSGPSAGYGGPPGGYGGPPGGYSGPLGGYGGPPGGYGGPPGGYGGPPGGPAMGRSPEFHGEPVNVGHEAYRPQGDSPQLHGGPVNFGHEIYNPSVPYIAHMRGFVHPQRVRIVGIPTHSPKRFAVNLRHGNEYIFHFNPRWDEHVIVRNSTHNGGWLREERLASSFPFDKDKMFTIELFPEGREISVLVNGKHFTTFQERDDPRHIDTLEVTGDIHLHSVHIIAV